MTVHHIASYSTRHTVSFSFFYILIPEEVKYSSMMENCIYLSCVDRNFVAGVSWGAARNLVLRQRRSVYPRETRGVLSEPCRDARPAPFHSPSPPPPRCLPLILLYSVTCIGLKPKSMDTLVLPPQRASIQYSRKWESPCNFLFVLLFLVFFIFFRISVNT
jgi:hypothetical protein